MINGAEWASEHGQITKLRMQTRALHDLRCEDGVSLEGEGAFCGNSYLTCMGTSLGLGWLPRKQSLSPEKSLTTSIPFFPVVRTMRGGLVPHDMIVPESIRGRIES